MSKNCFPLVVAAAVLVLGCASPQSMRPARNSLDRAIQYTEITQSSETIALSGKGTRVPNGTEVDINSTIAIHIDTDAIRLVEGYHPVEASALYPGSRAQKLADTLAKLVKLIESRKRAVVAYEKMRGIPLAQRLGSAAYNEFDQAGAEFGQLRNEFNTLPIWEDGTFPENVEPLFTKTYERIGPLLQRELNAAQTALQRSIDEANNRAAMLRLQAFLLPSKGDPLPIHLDGYDEYLKREVKMKDGFVMDADDRKTFEEQYAQTVQVAKEAEKVRTGETSLNDALMASGSASLQQLVSEAKSFESLLATDWPKTTKTLQQDLKDLAATTTESLKKHGETELVSAEASLANLRSALSTNLPIAELAQFVAQIGALRKEWARVTPDSFPDTFNKTKQLPSQLDVLKKHLESAKLAQSQAAIDAFLSDVQKRPATVSEYIWQQVSGEVIRSQSFQNAQSVQKQLQAAGQFLKTAESLLTLFVKVDPVKTGIRPPEVKDVPLAEAADTNLAIMRIPRLAGDQILVSASLQMGQTEVMRSDADFTVRYFGHHSVLAPSVILARPFQTGTSAEKNFQFAPAVAWLYKYYPRDSDRGFLKSLARISQGGVGVHVAFLNQNAQTGTEVGIGGAVSFWHDLFIAGAGVNLMNNSRGYLYVGSNLIPILQALGYGRDGKGGGAGKQP